MAVGDCLCLNMVSEKKDFVNSISAQNDVISSCLFSPGCQYLTLNVIREIQIKWKCRAGRIYDEFPEDKFNQNHYVLLHND